MTLQIRRDTSSNWTSANPTLAAGQFGFETDTGRIKVGDGTTAWTSLAYRFESAGGVADGDKGDITVSSSGTVWTIDNNTVTLSKLADLATSTILGRVTAGTGDPEALSASQVRTILNVADGANNYSHPNHSGDVTSVGDGATTIANGAVTLAKMANLAANSILGNNTGSPATPIALTLAQVRTLLNVADGANNYSHPNHSGDVTSVGDGATTIANDVVTNAKLANMATATLKGRTTAGTGDPEDLTAAQARTLLNVADGATANASDAALRDRATHTGTQLASTISDFDAAVAATAAVTANTAKVSNATHTGDVTGATALTIANDVVTNAKLANMATQTFKGRTTAGTGDPEDLTVAQAKTLLNLTGTNSGDQTITLTGDVTGSGTGSFAATVANNAVTNAKAADMATATIKGRATAGTGDPEDLTGTQATALLDTFTSGAKGLVPASGGGTTNFLRADGTWAAPPGGGGDVTDGDKGDITVSGGGATWTIDAGAVTLSKMANLAASTILGRATAGTGVPEALTASQVRTILNVADGATANASDASLRDRATHTGTQLAATISDFASAVAATAAVTANTAKVTNATHTGDVTGSGVLTIANDVVTNAKLANVATATIKGRTTAGTGDPEDLTASQAWGVIDDAALNTAQNWTKAQGSTPVALTDGANIATDASLSNVFTVTLGGNRTLDNPTNLVAGRTYVWVITQDGTGSRTLAYGTAFDFPGGTAPVLSTAAAAVDLITGMAISTSRVLCVANLDFS